MTDKAIRVLVVDDSLLIREMIADQLTAAGLEVVGCARDGHEALKLAEELRPDVVTLDVQMPQMDGLQTLEALLARQPIPVIMVSALTRLGASIALDALDRGAMDYIGKPENGAEATRVYRDELVKKIRAVAGADVDRVLRIRKDRQARVASRLHPALPAAGRTPFAPASASQEWTDCCIAIGISTGGPPALASLFEHLIPPLPPIVVVQHMPQAFTGAFAWRLDSLSKLSIKEAATGDVLRPNTVLIAAGGKHLSLRRDGRDVKAVVRDGDNVSGHKPSADVLLRSAAEMFGARCLGVIMTGMGRDGADGCGAIRAAGGYVLGQDEASSDVYGMNKAAFLEGHVDRQFSLDAAAATITAAAERHFRKPTLA